MATGLVWHERYMWHDTRAAGSYIPAGGWVEPDAHVENSSTKRRFKNLLDASGLTAQLTSLDPRPATLDEICRFHTQEYVDRIKALSGENGGDAGGLTPFGPGSYEIALLAAGGVIAAVDAVLDGAVDNAYALVRPPGHHALPDSGMGFCIFGNVAIAVKHARVARGVGRVAVIDWDVHHGNGTEAAFYTDPTVLTISLHQSRCFPPESGAIDRVGDGAGAGANLNIPLPPGCGIGAYLTAFERVVLPALDVFQPELIVIASGFDASAADPLGRMLLSSDAYRRLTRMVLDIADRWCGGRVVMAHEGGYSSAYVPFCGLATVETLAGIDSGVVDPFMEHFEAIDGQDLQPHQEVAIAGSARLVASVPAP